MRDWYNDSCSCNCDWTYYKDLFDDLHTKTINRCGTDRSNLKGMMKDFAKKVKWGDRKTRVRDNLTGIVWKDKKDINKFMSVQCPPADGIFL
jgi:hypothetical protein